MKIVAIDAFGVNPGDISWSPFHELGSFTAAPHFSQDILDSLAADADAILVDHVALHAERIARLPRLKYIGLFSTGYDRIDVDAAMSAGVAVTNVPDYSTDSVAELTLALILNLAHRVCDYNSLVHRGKWRRGEPVSYTDFPALELRGKSIAILGFGAIGVAVAKLAGALGMKVLGWEARRKTIPGVEVRWLSWSDLLAAADVVTLHTPLSEETTELIDRRALTQMKESALLINTSRGGLTDESAVAEALHNGSLAGAAVDVVGYEEPPEGDHPLLSAPNCIITPHIGWATVESRTRCVAEAAENLRSYMNGGRRNRIDGNRGIQLQGEKIQ